MSTNGHSQQRPGLSDTHPRTAPSHEHPMHQSTTQQASLKPLHQFQNQRPYPRHNPTQFSASPFPSSHPQNPPPQPYPLEQSHQHTASYQYSHYPPPNFPHLTHYPETQVPPSNPPYIPYIYPPFNYPQCLPLHQPVLQAQYVPLPPHSTYDYYPPPHPPLHYTGYSHSRPPTDFGYQPTTHFSPHFLPFVPSLLSQETSNSTSHHDSQAASHPTPPNPLVSGVSRQPSSTPPSTSRLHPQSASHSHSTGADNPSTTTEVPESGTGYPSRIIEDVINRHITDLLKTIGNDLTFFSNKFIELGIVSRNAYDNIRTKRGVGEREMASQLLNLVTNNAATSYNRKEWFHKFISVFSQEAAYKDLATSMTECLSSIFTSFTAPSSPLPCQSLQAHLHTTDMPSLSAEVEKGPEVPHSKPPSVHTHSQSSRYSHSAHMQHYIDYVKIVYKGSAVEKNPEVVKLQKMPTTIYINLVCIDRKSVENAREYDEVTKIMVQEGSVDAVHGKKWPINFDEIAANLPAMTRSFERVILVEGAPGVGKSTFAWEFCRRWERGEIAQQYQLVLLLQLRDEKIRNAKSLEDLIYHPAKDVCKSVHRELENSLGMNTLIILEGFDELPACCQKGKSIFLDLIAGKLLRLATILVTSRPWATRTILLNHRIYQHIEILGFNSKQITEYMESTLPQNKVKDLKAYLESHPQIGAGMSIPLNSAIVVTVYEESQASGCAMPTTLTDLYTSLARTLLHRYLRGHPEYEANSNNMFLQTFSDLPAPVYAKFCKVCELAYNGIIGTANHMQLIFRKSDMPSGFDDLGFMDSVIELYETRPEASSYNFLHLTFQEFFAAVYISSMSAVRQLEHFKRHSEGRLKVVLRFLAGFNQLNCFPGEEAMTDFFWRCDNRRYRKVCDAALNVDLIQWLFEAQSDDVIDRLLGLKTIEFDLSSRMLLLDYYSLGYCISHSQCKWVLGLAREELGKNEVRMLAAGVGTRREPRGRVVELGGHLEYRRISNKEQLDFLHCKVLFNEWKGIFPLSELSLKLPASCGSILWPDLSTLRILELQISDNAECKLHTLLPYLTSLESFVLTTYAVNMLLYEECVAIGDYVASTTSLKKLRINLSTTLPTGMWKLFKLADDGLEAITAGLASNWSLQLERLELEFNCTFSSTAADNLAKFITYTPTLQYLLVQYSIFSVLPLIFLLKAVLQHSADALAQALHHNSTLTQLNLKSIGISDVGADDLAQALHHNSTLTQLNLNNNNISFGRADAL